MRLHPSRRRAGPCPSGLQAREGLRMLLQRATPEPKLIFGIGGFVAASEAAPPEDVARQWTSKSPTAGAWQRRPLPIILVDGEKGGVGKSQLARLLVHLLTAAGIPVVGADGDKGNPHLERFYAKSIEVHAFALRNVEEWFRLTDLIADADRRAVIIIDAPAGVSDFLREWMPSLDVALEDLGRPLLRVWVMNTLVDSVIRLAASRDLIPLENTRAVLNGRDASRDKFVYWDSTNLRRDLLAAGGQEVFVPALHAATNESVHKVQLSFAEAARALPSFSQRVTLRAWLTACSSAFDLVFPRLEGRP